MNLIIFYTLYFLFNNVLTFHINVERLRELENENRDLRIENEFLKELGRLQEAEKQQQRNK